MKLSEKPYWKVILVALLFPIIMLAGEALIFFIFTLVALIGPLYILIFPDRIEIEGNNVKIGGIKLGGDREQ